MKKLLLIALLAVGIKSSAQTVLFNQNFDSEDEIDFYCKVNNPNIGQFNGYSHSLIASELAKKYPPTISIVNNKLNFDATPKNVDGKTYGGSAFITRSTDFSVIPLVMQLECDVEVSQVTGGSNVAFVFDVGQNFPHTGTASIITNNKHSSFGLRWSSPTVENPNDGFFNIRRINPGENRPNIYRGTQHITWVVNNSGADFTYTAPNGQETTIGKDKNHIWVGEELDYDDGAAAKPNLALKNFRITISSAGGANVALDNIKITSLKDTPPLPVTLTSFTGKAQNKAVLLNWATASEQNNKSFTLSRSHDGKTFEEITKIDGAGNSSTIKSYSYIDENPYPGVNYYQLQQEDFNGDRQEPVVIVVDSKISTAQLSVYTDAKGLTVNIASPNSINGNIQLYNISGQQLHSQRVTLAKGNNTLHLPGLATNGIYFIRYVAGGKVVHQKFKL